MDNKIPKGTKDRINFLFNNLDYQLNLVIDESKDKIKKEIYENLKAISTYFTSIDENLFEQNSIKKYYSGEKSPFDMPLYTITTARLTPFEISDKGDTINYILQNEEACCFYLECPEYKKINKGILESGYSYISMANLTNRSNRYIGYSDGEKFHLVYYDSFCSYDKDIDKYPERLKLQLGEALLKEIEEKNIPHITTKKRGSDSDWGDYTILRICWNIGCVNLKDVEAWCPKFNFKKYVNDSLYKNWYIKLAESQNPKNNI